ncbi:MAG TPA: hypothetical protein VER03_12040 [Bryobacteraceae bacterium]|nr:hypothetical protein [Bryobacteraceae bacterium]
MAEFQHINVKIFASEGSSVDWHKLIPVFHRWIREQSLPGLLLDVADYAHVPAGPGMMIVGHDAHYAVDNRQNRLGLLYNRRTAAEGSTRDRIGQAYEAALAAARKLEQESELAGTLRFDESQVEIWVNDRLLAPNTPETFAEFEAEVAPFLRERLGGGVQIERSSAGARDVVRVRTSAASHS